MTSDKPEATSDLVAVARKNLRLAVALRETNFSELARRAGLSRNVVSQFVSGRGSLSYANMLQVCKVLDIPIGLMHLFDGITQKNISQFQALEQQPPQATLPK